MCAIFSLYHLIFAGMLAAFVILLLPSACLAIVQVFSAALQLLLEASGAESA